MVKENIYAILQGFQRVPCPAEQCDRGYDLYQVPAWDYPALLRTYQEAADTARKYHIPALVHVTDATQPQGHSTSGSQERYKSKERLEWEYENDCLRRYRQYLIDNNVATDEQLSEFEAEDKKTVEQARKKAWESFQSPIKQFVKTASQRLSELAANSSIQKGEIEAINNRLLNIQDPIFSDAASAVHQALVLTKDQPSEPRKALQDLANGLETERQAYYNKFLFSDSDRSPLKVKPVEAKYSKDSPTLMGFEVLNKAFDEILAREPLMVAFGEDVGQLGDVNQAFRGLQEKYGPLRVFDTGIREATILGQAIGLALRGFRPIAEIQYLDYLLYALQTMADDLSNLRWRTVGHQQAPVIIRTRGHRLEGIFHSGSPMAGIINLIRGIHVAVPRNMTQAAGFYNTLIEGDDPALVVEVLNGYRLKERLPDNLAEFKLALGVPEVLREGKDLTLVTYGATVRIAQQAVERLAQVGIDVELIDVQTLLPFDLNHMIVDSLKKTSRVLFVDEDMPGGTTAYMMQEVLEKQGGYPWLDSAPRTLSAANHARLMAPMGIITANPTRKAFSTRFMKSCGRATPIASLPFFRRINGYKINRPQTGRRCGRTHSGYLAQTSWRPCGGI